MNPDNSDTTVGRSRRRFELGCGPVLLIVLAAAVALAIRMGQIEREKAAAAAVRELGGTLISGQETFATSSFQWLMPARVVVVSLAGTRATNDDLTGLKAFTRLERLDLGRTAITNGALHPLAGLSGLQTLSLEWTGIGDDDLSQLAGLTKLSMLRIDGTQVTDAGLDNLSALVNLECLSLSETKITDAGLARLGRLPRLKTVEIGESLATPAGAAHLQVLPSLAQVTVRIPRGTGHLAREGLASLRGVHVSGLRRIGGPGPSQPGQPAEVRLWDSATPWDASTGGVVEAILSESPLPQPQSERLLEVLAMARPDGGWWRQDPGQRASPLEPPPTGEPIKNDDEFLQTLKTGDWPGFARALAYARRGAAGGAVPRLLACLQSSDERLRYRAGTILIRIGLEDPRVVAAIRERLQSYDMHERARTVYMFHLGGWRSHPGDVVPDLDAAKAKTAVSLLLDVPEDEYWDVRSGLVDALSCVVRGHPREAERAVPAAVKSLNDIQDSVRHAGTRALEAIAETAPGQAKPIVQQLLRILLDAPGAARWEVVEAIGRVASLNVEAADMAVPVLLRLLPDKRFMPGLHLRSSETGAPLPPSVAGQNRRQLEDTAVPGAIRRIVERYPGHLKQVVPAVLPLLDDGDPWVRLTAAVALGSVAAATSKGGSRPPLP